MQLNSKLSPKGVVTGVYFFPILFFILVLSTVKAEAVPRMGTMDSLIYRLRSASTKVDQANIADEFLRDAFSFDSAKSISYTRLVISIGDSLHNTVVSQLAKAYCFIRFHNIDSSVYYYNLALSGLENPGELETKVNVESNYLNELNVEDKLATYKLSFLVIKDATAAKKYRIISDAYMNLNMVYSTLNIGAALSYADSSIKYAYMCNDSEVICNRLGMKAQTLMFQGNYDSAIAYVKRGLAMIKNIKRFSFARATIGLVLLDCYLANKDTTKFLEKVYPTCEYGENTPQPYWKAPCHRYRAIAFAFRGNYKGAIKYYLDIFNDPNFSTYFFKEDISEMYANLSECFAHINDFKNSHLYLNKSYSLFKELNNLNVSNRLRDQEALQQAEKQQSKDQLEAEQLKLEQAEVQKQKLQGYFLMGGLGILLLAIMFFIYNRRKILLLNIELAHAKSKAEQSEKYKQQFLANMSHEIRSPMNAVLGAVNLAVENESGEKNKKHLYIAQRSAQHLLRIINDILDLSKIEAGKLDLEQTAFSVNDVVNEVMDIQKLRADENEIELVILNELSDKDSKVIGDPLRLTQVLSNLLNNALKFTKRGSVQVKVWQSTGINPSIHFSIKDSGIGMTKEQLQNLFSEFSQATAATSRKFGGTGLGLAITKQLVELMHGTIEVESESGKGTTFTVLLPLLKSAMEQSVALENNLSEESWRKSLENISLILADDLEDSRTITHDLLLQYNPKLKIQLAANGKEVIDILQNVTGARINLLLLDLDMPVMNGFETAKIIRGELKPDLPIIALTASIMSLNKNEISKFGIDEVMAKPFVPKELFEMMEQVLNQKKKN